MSSTKSDDANQNFVYINTYLDRTKTELLINGYIKWIENEMNIIIPQPIIALFISFYYYTLPPHRIGSRGRGRCIVDEKKQIFSKSGAVDPIYAIFNTPWSKDKHELIFKCIQNKSFAFGIGLITNYNTDASGWVFDKPEAGITYQFFSCNASVAKPGIYCFKFGERKFVEYIDKEISNGTVIAVRVDLDEYSIKFYFDDEQQGKTMNLERDEIYYPAIAINSFELAEYQLILCD